MGSIKIRYQFLIAGVIIFAIFPVVNKIAKDNGSASAEYIAGSVAVLGVLSLLFAIGNGIVHIVKQSSSTKDE